MGILCLVCLSGIICVKNLCDDGSGNINVVGKYVYFDYLCMWLIGEISCIFVLNYLC